MFPEPGSLSFKWEQKQLAGSLVPVRVVGGFKEGNWGGGKDRTEALTHWDHGRFTRSSHGS